MTAAEWGALAAAAGVGMALVAHIIKYAYEQGKTDNRLQTIEKAQSAQADAAAILAAITSTVSALEKSVNRLDAALDRISSRVFSREP